MSRVVLFILSILCGLIAGQFAGIWLGPLESSIIGGVVSGIVFFAVASCQWSSHISQEEERRQ